MPTKPLLFSQSGHFSEACRLSRGVAYCVGQPSPERNDDPSEDAATIIPRGERAWVLAVADGLGGAPNGEGASKTALTELAAALTLPNANVDENPAALREAVLRGFDRANRAVMALGSGAGTTLAVVTLEGDTARAYYVGDSTILHFGNRGRMKFQSVSHSPVGYAVEAGLIDGRDALHHEALHIVSNVVGSKAMSVQMGPKLTLARYDTLLLASDGVSDNLYLEEIVGLLRSGKPATSLAALRDAASERMTQPTEGLPHKPDDLVALLVRRSV